AATADSPNVDTAPANNGEEKRQPVHKIRLRSITAAIWRNRNERGVWHSVTFSRSYKDENGSWQNTQSFGGSDLLVLAEVLRAAFLWIAEAAQAANSAAQTQAAVQNAQPIQDDSIPF